MKIYIDLILLLNFGFDFLLLLSVSLVLRRNTSMYKLLIGGFIGSVSVLTLFFNINSFQLFLIKILISIFMCISSFGFKNLKYTFKNILYLYISSIVLGGSLYLLNIEFTYKNQGIIFYKNKLSLNFLILVILSPIIIYIYIKETKKLRISYSNYHKVEIKIRDKIIRCTGYIDTGNKLKDPYKRRPIILMNSKNFTINDLSKLYVPVHTIMGTNLVECVKIQELKVDGNMVHKDVLLGFIDRRIKIDGIDCLLNCEIMEE